MIGRGARRRSGRRGARLGAAPAGAVVRSGATVERAILDDRVEVGRTAVGAAGGEITLIGLAERIAPGAEVPAGGRVPDLD